MTGQLINYEYRPHLHQIGVFLLLPEVQAPVKTALLKR